MVLTYKCNGVKYKCDGVNMSIYNMTVLTCEYNVMVLTCECDSVNKHK